MYDSFDPFYGRPEWRQRCLDALEAAGPGAVISHRTAAMIHGLLPIDESAPIDVTVPISPCAGPTRRR